MLPVQQQGADWSRPWWGNTPWEIVMGFHVNKPIYRLGGRGDG
jgi:hypothetical protein